jgi:coniferyl-aldehyde dehydrogenase
MSKLADLVEQHTEELAALDGADAGKLLLLGKMIDIPAATQMLRYYAGAADKIHGDVLRVSGKYQGYTLKEPIGVVGVIIPWNFPTMHYRNPRLCRVLASLPSAFCRALGKESFAECRTR